MKRNLPHKPIKKAILSYEAECYEMVEQFRNNRDESIQSNNVDLIGDFSGIALSLTSIAYWQGEPLTKVAEKANESVNIACKACEMGNYHFKHELDYYFIFWISIILGHEKNSKTLAEINSKYYSAGGILVGMLPDVMEMMRAFVLNGNKEKEFHTLESFLEMSLNERTRKKEAKNFVPIVEGFRGIIKKDQKLWENAEEKRLETWCNEARKYKRYTMFLLDYEWLGLCRLAKDSSLNIRDINPYVPLGILEIKPFQKRKKLGDGLLA